MYDSFESNRIIRGSIYMSQLHVGGWLNAIQCNAITPMRFDPTQSNAIQRIQPNAISPQWNYNRYLSPASVSQYLSRSSTAPRIRTPPNIPTPASPRHSRLPRPSTISSRHHHTEDKKPKAEKPKAESTKPKAQMQMYKLTAGETHTQRRNPQN